MKNLPMFDLTGKVAVITGGCTGIGREIAGGLAEAGCNVVICSRNYAACVQAGKEIAALGAAVLPIRCDVTSSDDIENLIHETVREMGGIDILVNNAGVEGKEKPLPEMSEEDWDSVVNPNLKGAFLCSRAAAKEMITKGRGKIINVASIAAFVGMPNVSAYCASKGGLVQLTKAMALEFVENNIQVNALCPGYFDTPMSRRLYEPEMWAKIVRRKVPMGRIGKPEELKGTAIYLASRASDFMTGSCIVIDGGQLIW
jgi:NAD(P)-dependent dehydrogenase (short-subunit alcohol dehydrogenase family)